ncbi:MAG: DUF1735 domain-containing protein [Marinilabiliales bacterium]|nr:DUF1735 domain-containing protein [Marinilabiliales bacterium]
MKRIFLVLMLAVAMGSCYSDYMSDYTYDGIYFPYQVDSRSFIVGEGMKIEIGADLGGVRSNDRDRKVTFAIDNSLVNAATLALFKGGAQYIKDAVAPVLAQSVIPTNYYTLSNNNTILIKAGQNAGTVVMKVDSAKFVADPNSLYANYVLPLTIVSADADTVLASKKTAVIGVHYENMLFGNYLHGGVTTVKDASGNTIQTIAYYTAVNQAENKIWKLTTVAPNALVTNGYSDQTTAKPEMKLTLDGTNLTIGTNAGSTYAIQPDGTSNYNWAKLLQNRKILLNYKYVNAAGNTCYARDTLTFRNRIRDGVNEWQDENPAHYN